LLIITLRDYAAAIAAAAAAAFHVDIDMLSPPSDMPLMMLIAPCCYALSATRLRAREREQLACRRYATIAAATLFSPFRYAPPAGFS